MIETTEREIVTFSSGPAFAKQADEDDPLAKFRNEFFIPQHEGKDVLYFTGNSLGLQSKNVSSFVDAELTEWARLGVEGHFHAQRPWTKYHEAFPPLLKELIGGSADEIIVMNHLTVNIHLLFTSFYRPTKTRFKIICEEKAFSSDQYAIQTQLRLHGFDSKDALIEVAPRDGEYYIRTEDIIDTIKEHRESLALVFFGGLNYYTGQVFNLEAISQASHEAGALAGFDLAHSAGNVELRLHDWNVDFACWCSYKYMNSGPGGVSGVFIHERWAKDRSIPRLGGWWGHDKDRRFLMEREFQPMPAAEGWQLSNGSVITMAVHLAALQLFKEAGMQNLRQKSKKLTAYLRYLISELNKELGESRVLVITPESEGEYGCQLSLVIRNGGRTIHDQLLATGIITDWREPEVMRVAPVPLYNSFQDVYQFIQALKKVLKTA